VLEGFRREVTVNDLCRREGIKPHSYYTWTKEFMEAGKEYHRKTTGSNQIWATDASYFRVMGWGILLPGPRDGRLLPLHIGSQASAGHDRHDRSSSGRQDQAANR